MLSSSVLIPTPASAGSTSSIRIPWSAFVRLVIDVTVQGYLSMKAAHIAKAEWNEDHFTINLEKFIRPIARQSSIQIRSQVHVYTQEMEEGTVSANEAVKIDIQLWSPWEEYEKVYFAWECKLIVDTKSDRRKGYLVSKYITEGVYRFLSGEYSKDVTDAGMIGYVLAGEPSNIVRSLNNSLLHPKRSGRFSHSDHLTRSTLIDHLDSLFVSNHNRTAYPDNITLHHLLLAFDFT